MHLRGESLAMGLFLLLAGVSVALGQGRTTPTPTRTPKITQTLTGAVLGRSLAHRFGCAACHSSDGRPGNGPTWRGLYGKGETLSDGTKMRVDEAYLHESIVDPGRKYCEGLCGRPHAQGLRPEAFKVGYPGPYRLYQDVAVAIGSQVALVSDCPCIISSRDPIAKTIHPRIEEKGINPGLNFCRVACVVRNARSHCRCVRFLKDGHGRREP